jgi:hypothetical protein
MSTGQIIDIEKQNLEAHVELCAQRYQNLDDRLTSIEGKVSDLRKLIEEGQNSMTKVIIGTAGTVIASVLGLIVVLLNKAG